MQSSLQALQASAEKAREAVSKSNSVAQIERRELTEQLDTLALRVTTLAASQLASSANDSADNQNAIESELAAVTAGIDERLAGIEDKVATVNSDSQRIASLTQQLQKARDNIEAMQQREEEATLTLKQLDATVSELKTAGESLSIDAIQTQIQQQLARLESQVEDSDQQANTAELESLLSATRSRIQTLEQRVQELPASSAAADDALRTQSGLEAQVAALSRQLQTLSRRTTDPQLESTVQDVAEQVAQLTAQDFLTQEDLQTQTSSEPTEYKIYFERNSAQVTEDAARVLDSFITQEKNRTTGVSIYGFTDRLGSAVYNQQLALQRATNVRSFLIQNGLDFTKIKALSGLGEDAAAADLPDNSGDAQQRVVVLYAEQP